MKLVFSIFLITITTISFCGLEKGGLVEGIDLVGKTVYFLYGKVVKPVQDYCEDHGRGQEAIKHVEHLKTENTKLTKAFQTFASNQDGLKDTTNAIKDVAEANKETNDILKEGLNKFEAVEKVGKAIGIVSGSIYIVKSGADFCNFVYHYWWPSEEQELKKAATICQLNRQLKILKSLDAMNECLVKNSNGSKDANGMPIHCNEAGELYARAAGYAALDEVEKAFKARRITQRND